MHELGQKCRFPGLSMVAWSPARPVAPWLPSDTASSGQDQLRGWGWMYWGRQVAGRTEGLH